MNEKKEITSLSLQCATLGLQFLQSQLFSLILTAQKHCPNTNESFFFFSDFNNALVYQLITPPVAEVRD